MSKILMGGGDIPRFDERTLCGMFAFRHEVFFKKLGWDVETHDSMEFDLFDTFNPVYMVAKDEHESIEGCWRLMPTTGSYMLRDTFPQLLRGEQVPCDKQIWELSRFAVDASHDEGNVQAPLNSVTMGMIRSLYDFAVENGIDQFVTVTSVALERLLKRTGLPIHRFGDGKAQRVGKVLTVACWVDINEQFANPMSDDEKAAFREKMIDKYEKEAHPFYCGARLLNDRILKFSEIRDWLCMAFELSLLKPIGSPSFGNFRF